MSYSGQAIRVLFVLLKIAVATNQSLHTVTSRPGVNPPPLPLTATPTSGLPVPETLEKASWGRRSFLSSLPAQRASHWTIALSEVAKPCHKSRHKPLDIGDKKQQPNKPVVTQICNTPDSHGFRTTWESHSVFFVCKHANEQTNPPTSRAKRFPCKTHTHAHAHAHTSA